MGRRDPLLVALLDRRLSAFLSALIRVKRMPHGAGPFGEEDGGGGGDVEAFEGAGAGDGESEATCRGVGGIHAFAFGAHYVYQVLRQPPGEQDVAPVYDGRPPLESSVVQLSDGVIVAAEVRERHGFGA